jgi:hypothetical protein
MKPYSQPTPFHIKYIATPPYISGQAIVWGRVRLCIVHTYRSIKRFKKSLGEWMEFNMERRDPKLSTKDKGMVERRREKGNHG